MPPLPKSSRRPSSTGKRERQGQPESSSAPKTGPVRSRVTKADVLQEQIARMYMMLGTMLKPFGRFYPVLDPVGDNFKDLSQEASEAWMELAQKDKKVMDALESITGASTWGNVIGIHIAIFASALPGAGFLTGASKKDEDENPMEAEFYRQGKAMGLTDEEIKTAMGQAMGSPVPARETGSGGPGDTVRVSESPADGGDTASHATGATATATSPAGIVTPDELGVTQPGEAQLFPMDTSPPNGRGTVE